jgi:hypothetical protein
MPPYDRLPPDLDARLVAVRVRAELEFADARKGRSTSEARRLLIELRIKPEVLAVALIALELADRAFDFTW